MLKVVPRWRPNKNLRLAHTVPFRLVVVITPLYYEYYVLCRKNPVVYISNSRVNSSQCFDVRYLCERRSVHGMLYLMVLEGEGNRFHFLGAKKKKMKKCLQTAASRANTCVPGA